MSYKGMEDDVEQDEGRKVKKQVKVCPRAIEGAANAEDLREKRIEWMRGIERMVKT